MFTKMTLPERFAEQAALRLEQNAFYYCRTEDREWVNMTWSRYREEVSLLAGWFQAKGIVKGDKIALLSPNRPEWIIADLAILSIGAVSVPIYPTASVSDINYILEHSEAQHLLVDNLDRIAFLQQKELRSLVCFEKASRGQAEQFKLTPVTYSSILNETKTRMTAPVSLRDEDIASIIYTSGTTGQPKGVIHSHGNFAESMASIYDILANPEGKPDRYFSFLPLSHVAERQLVEVGSILTGSEIAFARSIDTLAEDLVRCRPSILLCVPRLWEKIYEKIQTGLLTASPIKRSIFGLAKLLGEQRIEADHIRRVNNGKIGSRVSDILVGKTLRAKLGLDRCRMLVTGAAPTRPDVMRFFGAFGMLIREVYGLTENLCLGVLNDADDIVIGSCGKAFPGNEIKIAEDGEILFRAPWMFKGYYKDEAATRAVLDDKGWFATGDLGTIDDEARLRIVGRKKELLKTSGGKYIAPVPIEDKFKASSLVKDAMIVGDGRKYCIALLSIDETQPAAKTPETCKAELKKLLTSVNAELAQFESIKRIGILKASFSVAEGTLTPTLKVKRNVVVKQKELFIDLLYRSEEAIVTET